jgi:chromate transport protein ChrA
MAKRSKTYIWQFVLGLGFFSGLWTAIGIDPQAVLLTALGNVVDTLYSDPVVRWIFFLLPLVILGISVHGAFRKGRFPGLISVIIAYFAGVLIFASTATALILLGCAIFIGYLAAGRRFKKNLTF